MESTACKTPLAAVYRERLQQAKRVMESLSDEQRENNFDIDCFARQSTDGGPVACGAGHCGFDPWFNEKGFITSVGDSNSSGDVSISIKRFFGTERPFYRHFYPHLKRISVDHVIGALDVAIANCELEVK